MEEEEEEEEEKHGVVQLITYWPSPFAPRLKIALAEKGVDYEQIEEENFYNRKSPLLQKMNPIHKKIPVLLHRGRPVCESLLAVQYIDEVWKHKSPALLPSDPYQRARAKFWGDYIDQKMHKGGLKILRTRGEYQETAKREYIAYLKVLEEELGDKPYFGGEALGYVDIALVPFYSWFYSYEKCGKFCIEEECPKLIAWAKRCITQRESVAKSLPDPLKVYNDFVLVLRNTFWKDRWWTPAGTTNPTAPNSALKLQQQQQLQPRM